MPESKRDMPRFSAERFGKTDFAKVDAHVITAEEYEELPELTDEMMNRAVCMLGGEPVPHATGPLKEQVMLDLDADVIARFRALGTGWQDRVNEILREALG
ncbi:BrnA antitoxin family protein [Methylobacterium iners]|uniref:BrnA antitoxin of type II toxin-antitoxin system n=1 Tax=Methylobacterium iners TaxID=418707 RepID=A0ABQ4RVK9_9HYPH|nr:BrnA antitoxin family protein [Methylobacterium iners]GJD94237.1 hypothetical protein OCOJLMKI_1439 [Methylobacterium iners]